MEPVTRIASPTVVLPVSDIDRAERLYQRSLRKLDVSEHELVRHYPKFHFAMRARKSAETVVRVIAVELPAE